MSQADVVGKSRSGRVGKLRARTTRSASTIALVLVANDLQRGRDAREARIVAAATRLARVLARDGRTEMGFMAQWSAPIEGASLVPHLDLRERLMIVPRLGALARLPAFEAEIGAVLEQGQ